MAATMAHNAHIDEKLQEKGIREFCFENIFTLIVKQSVLDDLMTFGDC